MYLCVCNHTYDYTCLYIKCSMEELFDVCLCVHTYALHLNVQHLKISVASCPQVTAD